MLAAIEHRFGLVNRLPVTIEWLSDNGSCYIAGETRGFARGIGLEQPRTTPIESPQSNVMAEAFVRTIKRDYVRVRPCANAATVMRQLPGWIAHYNEVHPHKALGYRHPVSSSQLAEFRDRVRSFGGYNMFRIVKLGGGHFQHRQPSSPSHISPHRVRHRCPGKK